MNLQQLEYIVAVDTYRNFSVAAEKCFVTQPTLSMMIRKLETELDVVIFDRSRQPVIPTQIGARVIEQARVILHEGAKLKEMVGLELQEPRGELKVGMIPTIAPYLVPLFLTHFMKEYPHIRLFIYEHTTEQIIQGLLQQELDAGIMATPLHHPSLTETPLFMEELMMYSSLKEDHILSKSALDIKDINVHKIWLLEEGHCLRSQVLNLCEIKTQAVKQIEYEAANLHTLIKLVDMYDGMTILPKLAVNELSPEKKKRVRPFTSPAPARELSLVTHRYFIKQRLIDILASGIREFIPVSVNNGHPLDRVEIV